MNADDQCDGKRGGAFGACSDDRMEVWHGLAKPAIACGRHVAHDIQAVFAGHRARIGMPTATVTIYSIADVADALGITRQAVTNHTLRHGGDGTPIAPDYRTTDGRVFWESLDAWRTWHAALPRTRKSPKANDIQQKGR